MPRIARRPDMPLTLLQSSAARTPDTPRPPCPARLPSGPSRQRVLVAVTPLGPTHAPVLAYHSSVIVGRTEFSFSPLGVSAAAGPVSHRALASETRLIDCGRHLVDLSVFRSVICPLFTPGSYDLLKQNCNSFVDCALCFLTGRRLDQQYTKAESIGRFVDEYFSLVQTFSAGYYAPNPKAEDFSADDVADGLSMLRLEMRRTRAGAMDFVGMVMV
mmetsp:Transcript_24732/g.70581  ORF Transcript_24732/g.70581 Transcript_24732/m.70581 type:complete len:216 (+) Transcript_24732:63-710(+)